MDFDIFLLKGEDLIQPMPMSVNLVLNLKTAIYITLQIGNSSLQVSQLVNPQGGCKVTYIQYWPPTVPSLTFVLLGFDTLTLRGSISHKLFHQLIIFKMIPENIEKLHAIRVREAFTFPLLVILRPSLRNKLWAKQYHKKSFAREFIEHTSENICARTHSMRKWPNQKYVLLWPPHPLIMRLGTPTTSNFDVKVSKIEQPKKFS